MAVAEYWIGQNGNTYLRDSSGKVSDLGKTTSNQNAGGFTQSTGGYAIQQQANRVDDPLAPRAPAATTPAPAGGSGAAPKVLNTGAIQGTQVALDQLPALLQAALASEGQNHTNIMAQFDAEEGAQRKGYDEGTVTNQQNYDANYMDSVRAGIKGLGGLMNILRGTGAAGGSVEGDVRDIVGGVTADDIRGGADTQKANQGQLDTSLSTFLTDLKGKRQQNDDTFVNNQRAIQRDNASQMQNLYKDMAGYYGDADRAGERDSYLARASSLTPTIAANTQSRVSNYDATPVAVKAPELTAFAAPSQPDSAPVPQDGQVGSGIFTISNRRKAADTVPLALPAGA